MPDFHHNIYYYYRGAKQADSYFERQLEDNTTKALINTLEHCSPTVSRKFLNWLKIEVSGKVSCELQRKTIGEAKIEEKTQKVVLGIIPAAYQEFSGSSKEENKIDSRPDAWIYGDNFVVLVESKVVGNLDPLQLQHHIEKLKIGLSKVIRRETRRWSDIHRFFAGILPELADKNKWLVKQFTQYLEWIGMAEFTGFKPEIFDYFIAHDDEDVRKWVRSEIRAFAEILQPRLYELDHFYETYDLGVLALKNPYSWIAFGPGKRKYRQWAHQTIVIHATGIDVLINVELKAATDKLKRKIHHNKNEFKKHLVSLQLDRPLWIQIEERKQKVAMIYDYDLLAKIELDSLKHHEIGSKSFEYLETLLERLPYPYFSLRKFIDRDSICRLSQEDQGVSFLKEVIRVCKQFHPIVHFLNG